MDKNIYEITSFKQAKVISNKFRMKILHIFDDELPRTSKQLADLLGLPASKVHYHVRELAKVGLLELNKTHEKGGIIEKYYLPIAKGYRICLDNEPSNERGEKGSRYNLLKTLIEEYQDSFLDAEHRMELTDIKKETTVIKPFIKLNTLYLSLEKESKFYQELELFFQKWSLISNQNTKETNAIRLLISTHIPFVQT
ncbi:MAG: helix-turn-helix domain-containing protein [Paenibacillaceae bacterium]